jgi:tetratricopeptide (TPR) repeat protein
MTDDKMQVTDKANLLISQGKLDEAKTILDEFIKTAPADWQYIKDNGEIKSIFFWNQEEFLRYVDYIKSKGDNHQKIVWVGPSLSQAYYFLAYIETEKKHPSESLEYLQKAVNLEPDSPKILCELGLTYRSLGDLNKSIEYYLKVIDSPDSRKWSTQKEKSMAFRGAAITLIDQKKYELARKFLNYSLQLEPENQGTLNELKYLDQIENGKQVATEKILVESNQDKTTSI